jgi:hypothetical protein
MPQWVPWTVVLLILTLLALLDHGADRSDRSPPAAEASPK